MMEKIKNKICVGYFVKGSIIVKYRVEVEDDIVLN